MRRVRVISSGDEIASIDWMKAFFAVCVVAIHTGAYPVYEATRLSATRCMDVLVSCAVPFFYITSGYFMSGKMREWFSQTSNAKVLQRGLRKNLMRYGLWTALYLPITLYHYLTMQGRSSGWKAMDFIRGLIFRGEQWNSWFLWYVLGMIYALTFLLLIWRIRGSWKVAYALSGALFLLAGIYRAYIANVQELNILARGLCFLLGDTGRLFVAPLYLSIGMAIGRAKTLDRSTMRRAGFPMAIAGFLMRSAANCTWGGVFRNQPCSVCSGHLPADMRCGWQAGVAGKASSAAGAKIATFQFGMLLYAHDDLYGDMSVGLGGNAQGPQCIFGRAGEYGDIIPSFVFLICTKGATGMIKRVKRPVKRAIKAMQHMLSLLAFILSGTSKRNRDELERLRGAYKGKRCFLVCNGPSLRAEDLTRIHEHGDDSIAMNAIARIYGQTPWRPTFLSATDDMVFAEKNRELVKNCECGYKLYDRLRFLRSLDAKGKRLYLSFDESLSLLDHPTFSSEATKKLPSIGTSTYAMIEFAVFLGFSEIYILGCDMSYAVNLNRDGTIAYSETGKDHFYKKEEDNAPSTKVQPVPTWQMEVAFGYAAQYAREHGLRIYNATRGGKLEAFPRVDFDSLF